MNEVFSKTLCKDKDLIVMGDVNIDIKGCDSD